MVTQQMCDLPMLGGEKETRVSIHLVMCNGHGHGHARVYVYAHKNVPSTVQTGLLTGLPCALGGLVAVWCCRLDLSVSVGGTRDAIYHPKLDQDGHGQHGHGQHGHIVESFSSTPRITNHARL
jgi:hypothetical protein